MQPVPGLDPEPAKTNEKVSMDPYSTGLTSSKFYILIVHPDLVTLQFICLHI